MIYIEILKSIASENYEDNLVIFDFEEVTVDTVNSAPLIASVIQEAHLILPDALFAVSGTSFPNGFANQHLGENPIRERQLFQKVINLCEGIRFVYSDKGSAKAEQQNGGGGIPPYPRIDYPLKNDWRSLLFFLLMSKIFAICLVDLSLSRFWYSDLVLESITIGTKVSRTVGKYLAERLGSFSKNDSLHPKYASDSCL